MKLNNHGWGLKQMIVYSAILLMALFITVFFSMQLTAAFNEPFQKSTLRNVTYSMIEENIVMATSSYMEKYYDSEIGSGTITVKTDNLILYGVLKEEDLVTSTKDICKGYSLVRKNIESGLKIDAYIKCSNYETSNYQNWRMGEFYE